MALPAVDDLDNEMARQFTGQYERFLNPLVVVIAAYNEAGGIDEVLRRIPAEICGLGTDVLVVVDGSTDATADVARASGVLVCEVPVNRGQGAALRLGYRLARDHGARYIATLDADGQYDPTELALVVAPLVAGEADFVTGSRRMGVAHTTDRVRRYGVVVFGALISRLTGCTISDPANGLRAMTAKVTESVTLRQPQYQAAELLMGAILGGFRVIEVPTTMHQRTAGSTKKGRNLAYGWRFGRVIVGTWWRNHPRRARA
jgi:glycosyltransferase involved in cell wall biosynthesis